MNKISPNTTHNMINLFTKKVFKVKFQRNFTALINIIEESYFKTKWE